MPSPLSVDLRERVVAAVAAGASCPRAAARFGVPRRPPPHTDAAAVKFERDAIGSCCVEGRRW